MPQTEAQKRAVNKYQAKHYIVVGCKIRKEYAAIFQAACYEHNTTPATVLKAAIDSYLLQYGIVASDTARKEDPADGSQDAENMRADPATLAAADASGLVAGDNTAD